MFRNNRAHAPSRGVPILTLACCCAALLLGKSTASAQVHGVSIAKGVAGPNLDFLNPRAHVGDTANVQIRIGNFDFAGHAIVVSNVIDQIAHTSGTETTTNLVPVPITLTNLGDFRTITHTFNVLPNDPNNLVDTVSLKGYDTGVSNNGTNLIVTASAQATLLIVHPAIRVTKNCELVNTNNLDNVLVRYSGVVSNAGDILLHNVTVTDDNGTAAPGDDTVYNIGDLAVGATASFVGTNVPLSAFPTNSVIARGIDDTGPSSPFSSVADTNGCGVPIVCVPRLRVTKSCPPSPTAVNTPLVVTGTVTNTGNVTLRNVQVFNNQPAPGTLIFSIASLAPGQGARFTNSYTATTCPSMSDTFTASGTSSNAVCGVSTVTDTASATCTVVCPPGIQIVKEIVCNMPNGCESDWSHLATGVKGGTNCPTFCYRLTVLNTGAVALTNVVIADNKLPSVCQVPGTLAPGASASCIVSNVTLCSTTTNTATVTANSSVTGVQVSDTDTAVAVVKTASIECFKMVISPDAAPGDADPSDNVLVLPDDGAAHPVTFAVRVSNTGSVDLTNVTVIDSILEQGFTNCPPIAPFSLAAGATTNITICTVALSCNPNFTNVITVSAQASRGTNNLCVYDARAHAVTTVASSCDAYITCEAALGCRTTGGGRQEKEKTFPEVRYVTHGGQVGAPVGEATAFSPDSACIRGEFEHVRHYKGGLRGNFHARTFDSLMCACLACDQTPGNLVGRLCNPGDRQCGPEPRKAGANKIAFSGVGDYVLTNGRRTPRSVLFRIDIEDRSEPGGSHPKGGTPPPDRYRIRIWVLTAQELAQLNDPSNKLLTFRQAIAASETNTPLLDGTGVGTTPTPLGTAVFGVRAPDIDDGGELDRGNRQIHPQIKNCP